MAEFDLNRNGVPFSVTADNEEVANSLLDDALQADPEMLANKAESVGLLLDEQTGQARKSTPEEVAFRKGLAFDFETGQVRERTAGEKFAIGAGKTFTDIDNFISDVFNPDEITALEINRRSNEQEAFDTLDNLGLGAEDVGQNALEIGTLLIGLPIAATRAAVTALTGGGLLLAKIGARFGLKGPALRTFVKEGAKKKITSEVLEKAVVQPAGKAAVKKLAETTSPKTVKTLVDTISKNANKKVRAAQVKIARELRAQEGRTQSVSIAETAAQRTGAQTAASSATSQRAAQEALKAEAKAALGVAGQSARREGSVRLKRELRELIRKQSTGG